MTNSELITILIACIALIVSGLNFFYDRFYDNNQLLVNFSGIKFEESNIGISVIFVNNSKRYYAIKSITLVLQGKDYDKNKIVEFTPSKSENNSFALKPGEITVKYIKTLTGLNEIESFAENSHKISFDLKARVYYLDNNGKEGAIIIPLYEVRIHENDIGTQGIHSGPIDIIRNADKRWNYSK